MKQQEMIASVAEDLRHIPDGPDYDAQGELRLLYNRQRRIDLKLGKSRKDSITECIRSAKSRHPDWQPKIDKTYFGLD